MRELDRLLNTAGKLLDARAANPQLLAEMARYRDDPVGFAADVLGLQLWEAQAAILRLPLEHRNSTVVAANNVGKSFSLAALILFWLYARQGCVVTIAPVEAQLRSLWRDVRTSWFESQVKLPGELLEMGLRVSDAPPVWAISRTTGAGLKLKGLHSRRPLLVVADEADVLHTTGDDVWGAALTLGGGAEDRFVACGNPTGAWGVWYDRCADPTWGHLALSALDHPNVIQGEQVIPTKISRQWVEQIATLYGTDSAQYQRQVLGQFSDDQTEVLVRAEWLATSYAQHDARALVAPHEPLRIGVDPSMGGSDRFAVAVVDGGHVTQLVSWVESDTMKSVGRLVALLLKYGVARDAEHQPGEFGPGRDAAILIDVAFGGKVVFDLLRSEGWPVTAYWSNGSPEISEDLRRAARVDPDLWADVEPWGNRRAQCFCTLARMLREGKVALPRNALLAEELLAMHVIRDPRGNVLIEGKGELRNRLGRSPDLADAVSMALGTVEPANASCTIGGAVVTF